MKKMAAILLFLGFMLATSSAHATWGIRTCTIDKIGVENGLFCIWLTDTTASEFTNEKFYFHSAVTAEDRNKYIALLLTASSLTAQVDVNLNPPSKSTIVAVYYLP